MADDDRNKPVVDGTNGHLNCDPSGSGTNRSVGRQPVQSGDRILVKLKTMIDNNQLYEAHQLYRTLYFRYQNWGKFRELQKLLFDGAVLLLDKGQTTSGADLASLYLESLTNDPEVHEVLNSNGVYSKIGQLLSKIPSRSQERFEFVVKALKLDPARFDLTLVHYNLAIVLFREKNYPDSRYHFLHCGSSAGKACAQMLIEYQISQGCQWEVDLFIAQFVLQVLCIKPVNVKAPASFSPSGQGLHLPDEERSIQHGLATQTLKEYVERHPQIHSSLPPFPLPLVNFLWFLLLAIPYGQAPLFRILCEIYALSISRDPEYKVYLKKIGQIYFGIAPPPQRRPGGIFGSLLQSLMGDFDDDTDDSDVAGGGRDDARGARPTPQTSNMRPVQDEELD